MKKFILVILIFLFAIPVKADLTETQQDNIKTFTEKFVETGLNKKDKNGYPLFAYMQGQARIDGYQGKTYRIYYDYQKINYVNTNKWTFDCASFVSFIYKNMFDLILTTSTTLSTDSYSGLPILNRNGNPYMVSNFVNDADKGLRFYYVLKNVNVKTIDYSKMHPGDLVIIKGSHIMMYIGDGKIAHATTAAITKNKELGIEISTLEKRCPDKQLYVIRIKNHIINPTNTGNMKVTWPDDNTISDFTKIVIPPAIEPETPIIPPVVEPEKPIIPPVVEPEEDITPPNDEVIDEKPIITPPSNNENNESNEDKPNVVPTPNDLPKINYHLSDTDWTTSLNIIYSISDLDGISEYSISNNLIPNYQEIDKVTTYNNSYKINKNGTYYIYAKDINNNVSDVKIEINNIDFSSPKINSIKNENNKIIIDATDLESGLAEKAYSFDGLEWTSDNTWIAPLYKSYIIKIRDKVGNVITCSVTLKENKKEDNNTSNNNKPSNNDNNKNDSISIDYIIESDDINDNKTNTNDNVLEDNKTNNEIVNDNSKSNKSKINFIVVLIILGIVVIISFIVYFLHRLKKLS